MDEKRNKKRMYRERQKGEWIETKRRKDEETNEREQMIIQTKENR